MRKVFILRGGPGSGKSTYAKDVIRTKNISAYATTICSADDFFTDSKGGYNFDPNILQDAHRACYRKFCDALSEDYHDVVVDNTNTSAIEIAPYLTHALAYDGVQVEIVHFYAPFTPQIADLLAGRTTHGVPAKSILSMLQRLAVPLPKFWPAERRIDVFPSGLVAREVGNV